MTKTPEFLPNTMLTNSNITLKGGKVAAIPENIYQVIYENINSFSIEEKTTETPINNEDLKENEKELAQLQNELKDIDEALEEAKGNQDIEAQIKAYRTNVEDKINKLEDAIKKINEEAQLKNKKQALENEILTLKKLEKTELEKQIQTLNALEEELEKINIALNVPNPEVEKTQVSPEKEETQTPDKEAENIEEEVNSFIEEKEEKEDLAEEVEQEPSPLYSIPDIPLADPNKPPAKEEAELIAYYTEKKNLLKTLENYTHVSSTKNKEKKELLEKLAKIEEEINKLQEKIKSGNLTYREEKTEITNQEKNDSVATPTQSIYEPYKQEEKEFQEQVNKIKEQLKKLKAIDTPNARAEITLLEEKLKILDPTFEVEKDYQTKTSSNKAYTKVKKINTATVLNEMQALENNLKNLNINLDPNKITPSTKEKLLKELSQIERSLLTTINNVGSLIKTNQE